MATPPDFANPCKSPVGYFPNPSSESSEKERPDGASENKQTEEKTKQIESDFFHRTESLDPRTTPPEIFQKLINMPRDREKEYGKEYEYEIRKLVFGK